MKNAGKQTAQRLIARDALNNPADDGLFCYGALLQVFTSLVASKRGGSVELPCREAFHPHSPIDTAPHHAAAKKRSAFSRFASPNRHSQSLRVLVQPR